MKRKTKITLTGGIGVTAVIVFLLTPVLLLALADIQAISGSEDIQISHALTLATLQASKALKHAHMMQDLAELLDQADQRDEENNIGRMIIRKIVQQGGE